MVQFMLYPWNLSKKKTENTARRFWVALTNMTKSEPQKMRIKIPAPWEFFEIACSLAYLAGYLLKIFSLKLLALSFGLIAGADEYQNVVKSTSVERIEK